MQLRKISYRLRLVLYGLAGMTLVLRWWEGSLPAGLQFSGSLLILFATLALLLGFADFLGGKTFWIPVRAEFLLASLAVLAWGGISVFQINEQSSLRWQLSAAYLSAGALAIFCAIDLWQKRRAFVVLTAFWLGAFVMGAIAGLVRESSWPSVSLLHDPSVVYLLGILVLSPVFCQRPMPSEDGILIRLDYRWVAVDLLAYGMQKLRAVGITLKGKSEG